MATPEHLFTTSDLYHSLNGEDQSLSNHLVRALSAATAAYLLFQVPMLNEITKEYDGISFRNGLFNTSFQKGISMLAFTGAFSAVGVSNLVPGVSRKIETYLDSHIYHALVAGALAIPLTFLFFPGLSVNYPWYYQILIMSIPALTADLFMKYVYLPYMNKTITIKK